MVHRIATGTAEWLPGDEVDALGQGEAHHRPGDRVHRAEDDKDDRGLHRGALVSLEALLLLGTEGKHLDQGVSLPDDGKADDSQRGAQLEEALNHAREVVCATNRVTLGGDRLDSEQAQEDDGERCLARDFPGQQ